MLAKAPPTKKPRANTPRMSPRTIEVAPDETPAYRGVVHAQGGERPFFGRCALVEQRREGRLGRQASRLDGVVHAFERRNVHHPGSVATQEQPRSMQGLGQGREAAGRDGLGSPLEALPTLEHRGDLGVGLELLEQVVDR